LRPYHTAVTANAKRLATTSLPHVVLLSAAKTRAL